MDSVREIMRAFFQVDSIWSIVFRAGIWIAIALVIIVSTDTANPDKSIKNLKSNLGFFLLFTVLSGILIYFLFGFAGAPSPS